MNKRDFTCVDLDDQFRMQCDDCNFTLQRRLIDKQGKLTDTFKNVGFHGNMSYLLRHYSEELIREQGSLESLDKLVEALTAITQVVEDAKLKIITAYRRVV